MCSIWSLEGFPSAGCSHCCYTLRVVCFGCPLLCALGSLYSRETPALLIAHFSSVASKCVCQVFILH